MTDVAALAPWSGIDNFHAPSHLVFQPQEGARAALVAAQDIDITDEGLPVARQGLTKLLDLDSGVAILDSPWRNVVLVHDGSVIFSYNLVTKIRTNLIGDLTNNARGLFCEKAGKVFHTNGEFHSVITSPESARNWGMQIPSIAVLGSAPGALPAGRYRVACCLIDAAGTRSGAPEAASIELDGTSNLVVGLTTADPNAVAVRIYASYTNEPDLYFVKQVGLDELPTIISDVSVSNEVLETQFLIGPQGLPGIIGISSWRGYLLVWRGARIMHSVGNWHHLFDVRTAPWKLPYPIVAVASAGDVCWIATEKGMFSYTGEPPNGRLSDALDTRDYAAGSLEVARTQVPFFKELSSSIAVFASEDGLIVGTPEGALLAPHNQQLKWDVVGKRASIVYREQKDLSQILVSLS